MWKSTRRPSHKLQAEIQYLIIPGSSILDISCIMICGCQHLVWHSLSHLLSSCRVCGAAEKDFGGVVVGCGRPNPSAAKAWIVASRLSRRRGPRLRLDPSILRFMRLDRLFEPTILRSYYAWSCTVYLGVACHLHTFQHLFSFFHPVRYLPAVCFVLFKIVSFRTQLAVRDGASSSHWPP